MPDDRDPEPCPEGRRLLDAWCRALVRREGRPLDGREEAA